MLKVNGGELLLITLNNASWHDYQPKGSSFNSRFCATLNYVIFIAWPLTLCQFTSEPVRQANINL